MTRDKFPNVESKKEELTLAELEKLLKVKFDSGLSSNFTLDDIKSGFWVRFLVDPNFNVVVGKRTHDLMAMTIGVDRYECLIPDGLFKLYKDIKTLRFVYDFPNRAGMDNINQAAEKKIKEFLQTQGFVINK